MTIIKTPSWTTTLIIDEEGEVVSMTIQRQKTVRHYGRISPQKLRKVGPFKTLRTDRFRPSFNKGNDLLICL